MITRSIPSSSEQLPVIGLGTWQTFNVDTHSDNNNLKEVLHTLINGGGTLIDSSPMYGRSETMVGKLTEETSLHDKFFYATKVWTTGKLEGIRQMEDSMKKMRCQTMDLMQIHNLVDWQTHLDTLQQWKEEGRIRYIGITHYTDSYHEALEEIITKHSIDFVQFNYSIFSRNAENRLLPAAAANGVATLINRPLGEGKHFQRVMHTPLPEWCKEAGIESWSQFFLKYIIAHPTVTCVIPATANPAHMLDNVKAGNGQQPDEQMLKKMAQFVDEL